MRTLKNFTKEFGLSVLSLGLPFLASAQALPAAPQTAPTVVTSLGGVLGTLCTVINWMFVFLIVLAVIFIIVAAFRYLTASGDPEKVKGASAMLLYAAIAVAVAILAKGIPLIVSSFFGAGITVNC